MSNHEHRATDNSDRWLTCILLDPEVTAVSPMQLIAELEGEDIERVLKALHTPVSVG